MSIDKKLLKKRYWSNRISCKKNRIKKNSEVMLIWNKKLSVCPITTHIRVKDIHKKISQKVILTKINFLNKNFKLVFKRKPKIGILGLNPHNAEMSSNSEEKKIILPAIKRLTKRGVRLKGPIVSDTVFIDEYKKYDVIVGIYHDQVLSPFKTIFKFNAINITLGLKYLRLSPDHGTAKNLIGKNKANFLSLYNCIKFINKFRCSIIKITWIDKNIYNISISNSDILKFNIEKNCKKGTIIFGNLPYNISSQILIKFIKFKLWPPKFTDLIFMFQKELGEKILGKFSTIHYSRISIISSYRLSANKKFLISPNCFFPKPKINSILIHFKPKSLKGYKINNSTNIL